MSASGTNLPQLLLLLLQHNIHGYVRSSHSWYLDGLGSSCMTVIPIMQKHYPVHYAYLPNFLELNKYFLLLS